MIRARVALAVAPTARGRLAALLVPILLLAPACGPGEAERAAETATAPADTPRFDMAPGTARNVILLSIDTLRADHLGCYGYARETSPTIDGLAGRGALFEEDVSVSSWTVPAHMTMLTGLYPRSHGVDGGAKMLPPETSTLAQYLSGQGFVTGAFVNTGLLKKHDFPRGFGRFELFSLRVDPAQKKKTPKRGVHGSAPEIFARARGWLKANGQARFFLFLHVYDVHTDYAPRPEYLARFERPYSGSVEGTTAELRDYMMRAPGAAALRPEDARRLLDLYDAEIRQLDDVFAGFLASLQELGVADDTLLIVTSDHGEEFLEHGDVMHARTLHSEVLRVPLILVGPGVPRGARFAGQVSPVDLFPTITALLGVSTPQGLEGLDLTAAWRTPLTWPRERALFSETSEWPGNPEGSFRGAIHSGSHTLHYDRLSGRKQLFRHADDPGELKDIAAQEPERVQALWHELEAFLAGARELEDRPMSEEELQELQALGYR